jgi:hypothetical protein
MEDVGGYVAYSVGIDVRLPFNIRCRRVIGGGDYQKEVDSN